MLLDGIKTNIIITWIQIQYVSIENCWDKLRETSYFAEKLRLRKSDYGNVITAYVLLLAPKVFFLTILVNGKLANGRKESLMKFWSCEQSVSEDVTGKSQLN